MSVVKTADERMYENRRAPATVALSSFRQAEQELKRPGLLVSFLLPTRVRELEVAGGSWTFG